MIKCLVPARGGSKGIPLKNIHKVAGKPLIWWVLNAASGSIIDEIYVATDSARIKTIVEGFGFPKVKVISRSEESANDTAMTEVVMCEFYDKYIENDDLMVLIQPTSPLLTYTDINNAIDKLITTDCDSLLTVTKKHNFVWYNSLKDVFTPSYRIDKRPMRQEHDGYLVENGSLYLTSAKAFGKNKVRVSEKITHYEMGKYSDLEIDDYEDIELIEVLLNKS